MKKNGFSLIEVLISTAILLVIVVMVSMVFQQQSAAFQSGEDRVKGQAVLRNVIGMITHDLALAVNPAEYEGLDRVAKMSISGTTLTFWALTGEVGADAEGKANAEAAALQLIKYSGGSVITREAQSYASNGNGGWKTVGGKSRSQLNNSDTPFRDVEYVPTPSITTDRPFPSNVVIRASYAGKSGASSVSGQSAGPDKRWDTDDDIYVGGK